MAGTFPWPFHSNCFSPDTGFKSHINKNYNAWKKLKMDTKKIQRAVSNPDILSLLFFLPARYLFTTLLYISYDLIWILMHVCIYFKQFELRGFFLNAYSFFHNFFIIDVILIDSFLCMHHVGFNVLKIRPLRLAPFWVLLKTYCESLYFLKLHIM